MSEFFDSFNAVLPEMESEFGENWILNNTTYPAIAIDHESQANKAMRGGEFEEVYTTIYVRLEVFTASKVEIGSLITARGQDFVVFTIESEGDDSRGLICRSAQLDVWR